MDTLNLVFIGMIAFVGDLDSGPLWSFMVDVRNPQDPFPVCEHPANYGTDDLSHEAFVVVPVDAEVECDDPVDEVAWEAFSDEKCRQKRFVLGGHDVQLTADFTKPTLRRDPLLGNKTCSPANHEQARAFEWIANVRKIADYRAKVKETCWLADPYSPSDDRLDCPVLGRMVLPPGRIGTGYLKSMRPTKCKKGKESCYTGYFTWEFLEDDQMSDDFERVGSAAAEEISMEVETSYGQPRLLTITRYDDSRRTCTVSLGPGEKTVWFVNAQEGLEYGCDMSPKLHKRSHLYLFQEFYKVSETANEKGPCPYPREVCSDHGSPRCPLALMSPQ